MLSLECLALATLDLKIEESGQVRNFFLHRTKTDQTIHLLQALSVINFLRSLVRDITLVNGHHFLIAHGREIAVLQSLGLTLTYLVEE